MTPEALAGLDLLDTAVVLVDAPLTVRYLNPSAENLFELSNRNVVGIGVTRLFSEDGKLAGAIRYARDHNCSYTEHDLTLAPGGRGKLHLACTVTPVKGSPLVSRTRPLIVAAGVRRNTTSVTC